MKLFESMPRAIITVSVGIIFLIAIIVALPWIILGIGILLMPNPPSPEIRYGEFPFRLVYEIDGEEFVVEDVFIAQYDGIGMNTGRGKYRRWKGWVESSGESTVVLVIDNNRRVYSSVGWAEYYMNDEISVRMEPLAPNIFMRYTDDAGTVNTIRHEELYIRYNIKLIDWKLSDPIVNSFN